MGNKNNSKGIIAKAGRYGGTYAHKDIAFEFASWISPKFKLYLIKEFQRLKDEEKSSLAGISAGILLKSITGFIPMPSRKILFLRNWANPRSTTFTPLKLIFLIWPCSAQPPPCGVRETPIKREILGTMPMSHSWFVFQTWRTWTPCLLMKNYPRKSDLNGWIKSPSSKCGYWRVIREWNGWKIRNDG